MRPFVAPVASMRNDWIPSAYWYTMPSDRNVRHVGRLAVGGSLQLFPTYHRPPVLRVNVVPTLFQMTIPSYIVLLGAVGTGHRLESVLFGKVIT